MKTMLMFLVTLVICSGTAHARLGETEAECVARFGNAVSATPVLGETAKVFQRSGFIIVIVFQGGKSASENYRKGTDGEALSKVEIEALLEANASGSTWNKDKDFNLTANSWTRSDLQAAATYKTLTPPHDLLFMSRALVEKMNAEKKAAEKKALQKF